MNNFRDLLGQSRSKRRGNDILPKLLVTHLNTVYSTKFHGRLLEMFHENLSSHIPINKFALKSYR